MRAAIHRREDADIIAGRHPSVGTADAIEGRGKIEVRHRLDVDAKRIVLGEIAHPAILGMNMLARRNWRGRKADDLAVAADRFADRDGTDRNLVAGGNALDRGHAIGHDHSGRKLERAISTPSSGCSRMTGAGVMVVSPFCFYLSPFFTGRGGLPQRCEASSGAVRVRGKAQCQSLQTCSRIEAPHPTL